MKIYHTTNKFETLKEGLCAYEKHEDTEFINSLIDRVNNYEGCFDRDYCVFFNINKKDYLELTYSVDVSQLESNKLFIADQDIANTIFDYYYKGKDVDMLIKNYIDSIKLFNLEIVSDYKNPEIFYTDDVARDILKIEDIELDSLEEFISAENFCTEEARMFYESILKGYKI